MYPLWTLDVAEAGFSGLETFSFDVAGLLQPRGVAGSHPRQRRRGRLPAARRCGRLRRASSPPSSHEDFPSEPLAVPHRVWALVARAARKRPSGVSDAVTCRELFPRCHPPQMVAGVGAQVDAVVEAVAEGGPIGLLLGPEARLGLPVGTPVR